MKVIIDNDLDNKTFIIDGKKLDLVEMKRYKEVPKEIQLNQKNADIMMFKAFEHGEKIFLDLNVVTKKPEEEEPKKDE